MLHKLNNEPFFDMTFAKEKIFQHEPVGFVGIRAWEVRRDCLPE